MEVNDPRAERLTRTHDPLELMENSNNPYNYLVFHQDQPSQVTYMQQPLPNNNYILQPSFNQNYMQQPMINPEDIFVPTTEMNMALALMAKAFKLNYSTPTNNNQRISSNPRNRHIAQPGMNMRQDRQMQMVEGNDGNQFRQYAGQNVGNLNGYNANANQNGNGNVVASRTKGNGNGNGNNKNEVRCSNCREMGRLTKNCTVRLRRMDVAYLQTQLLIAQKEEAWIQLQAEEFDLMAVAWDLDEIEEVNANCILMVNLQQTSTSGTQTDKAPVYDSDRSAEVHEYENYYNNKIFNMFTQEEQYTELLDPIIEPHQLSKEKSIVSYLHQEKKKLKSDFKIREDELLDKQIQLENKIKELDNILVKMGQSIKTMHMLSLKPESFYHTEKKMALGYQNPFYLKQAQQKQQCLYKGKVLLEKHDPPVVYDSEETLQLAQESQAAKFFRDFKSLAKEADASLDKHKALEFKIERLLRAVDKEYDVLWNNWYKKCEECKYYKISYDKAYNDMQNKIERLQAQLGDIKGKSMDTQCASNTLDPLSQKLDDENVELEFQVLNNAKENTHLKTTYKTQSK
ncbi:hypothetical protein Tco_0749319 [Tanacetum coccineum]|uniref:CCHC-type domain-containing protein n=1 Tax=Tanacetum coccineum TaxID=301880 RepID=A0ABQ4Z1K8_9ASTR